MNYKFNADEHIHEIKIQDEWKPLAGTSTVVGVLAKGGLTWWASGMAVSLFGWMNRKDKDKFVAKEKREEKAGARLEEIKLLDPVEYLKLLDDAYSAHSKKLKSSAVAGTDLHAEIERYIKAQIDGVVYEYDKQIQPFVDWATTTVDKFLWSELHCYSESLWVGGISDAGYIDKDGKVGILDIKSSKEAYTSHFIQCAGYDIQITENGGYNAEGEKTFELGELKIDHYTIFPFGMDKPEAKVRFNADELKEGFKSAVCLHKLVK